MPCGYSGDVSLIGVMNGVKGCVFYYGYLENLASDDRLLAGVNSCDTEVRSGGPRRGGRLKAPEQMPISQKGKEDADRNHECGRGRDVGAVQRASRSLQAWNYARKRDPIRTNY